MTDRLDTLRDIDDEIFETLKFATPFIDWFFRESPIPKTSELCWMFITSTNFIKNSIFDCAETEDVYSVKVLMRSLLEHFLRFNYINMKFIKNGNDSESQKYFSVMEVSENIRLLRSIKNGFTIIGDDSLEMDKIWDEFCEKFPKYKVFDKKEIENLAKELTIKNILDYTQKEIGKTTYEFSGNQMSILIEYSNLSSFVHGGVYAYKNTTNLTNREERFTEILRICGLALLLSATIKYLSYLIFSKYKSEFADICIRTDKLIKKIK